MEIALSEHFFQLDQTGINFITAFMLLNIDIFHQSFELRLSRKQNTHFSYFIEITKIYIFCLFWLIVTG